MNQKNSPLSIIFFSSSDFTLPIISDICEQKNGNLYTIASTQLNIIERNQLLFPQYEALAKAIETGKNILESLDIGKPAIITQPDRENRDKINKNPISKFSGEYNLPLFQPERIRKSLSNYQTFLDGVCGEGASIGLVASFGQILPVEVIKAPTYGIINWHPSLLPKHRGATPMQTSIIQGEAQSGLSWINMDEGMDSGDIILQINHQLGFNQTLKEIAAAFGDLGRETWAIAICMQILSKDTDIIRNQVQDHELATFTKMLTKEDKLIEPNLSSAQEIINHFRAYFGFPGSVFESKYFEGLVRIDEIDFEPVFEVDNPFEAGELLQTSDKAIYLKTKNGFVRLKRVTLLSSGKSINFQGYQL